MNTLNLIQLNLRSPYEVWNESENDYFFVTDYGVVYKISFGDDAPIWKSGAYTFDIQNTNQKTSPSDQKVKMTIISIVKMIFFRTSGIFQALASVEKILIRSPLLYHRLLRFFPQRWL